MKEFSAHGETIGRLHILERYIGNEGSTLLAINLTISYPQAYVVKIITETETENE